MSGANRTTHICIDISSSSGQDLSGTKIPNPQTPNLKTWTLDHEPSFSLTRPLSLPLPRFLFGISVSLSPALSFTHSLFLSHPFSPSFSLSLSLFLALSLSPSPSLSMYLTPPPLPPCLSMLTKHGFSQSLHLPLPLSFSLRPFSLSLTHFDDEP